MADTNGVRNGISAARVSLPLLWVLGTLGTVAAASGTGAWFLAQVHFEIQDIRRLVLSGTDSRWRRSDQIRFCYDAERHPPNKKIGWECPPLPGPPNK